MPYKTFKDNVKLNQFFTGGQNRDTSPLWNLALKQVLCDGLIDALRDLHNITALLNTSPQFSEHDMLVFDHKRASVHHKIVDVDIPPATLDSFHITESCGLAAAIYSILSLCSFKPPLKLYGDLSKRLWASLQTTDRVGDWRPWDDMLLWTLFVGGYAALERPERIWYSMMIGRVLQGRDLMDWYARIVLKAMPVHYMLWEPFETRQEIKLK